MSQDGNDLTKILATIAKATADEKIKSPQNALAALGAGLVSVHADAVEDFEYSPAQLEHGSNLALHGMIEALRDHRPTLEQRAKLNSFLLTTGSSILRPGNIYATEVCGIKGFVPGKALRGFIKEIFSQHRLRMEADQWESFVKDAAEASVPACVEITPACDHAAEKSPVARLLMGILIRLDGHVSLESDTRIPAESRLFARDVEPVWLETFHDKMAGVYKLLISARHFTTLPVGDMKDVQPVIRLRHPVVADIQSWFASHASRPGYASVH